MNMLGDLQLLQDRTFDPYVKPRCLEEAIFYDLVTD
jgi:hypothetical protein